MTWLETRSSRKFKKHLRYPERIGILFRCCIRKWSRWPNLGPQSGAKVVITEWGMFQMGILFILKYTLLVKNRHFHCKIYRKLSKIWKKRLVQVKHIYSGSFFPGNKITSVYRSWHGFCQKSRFSEKSKIPSNIEGNISRIDGDMHSIFSDTVKDVILYLDSKYRLVTSTERRDMPW